MVNSKISDILSEATQIMASGGISSSKLDAVILLSHVLSCSKEQIIFNPDTKLNLPQIEVFSNLMKRRLKREPVSHIIGKREFFFEEFFVNEDVLDPRPDSEILIEAILKKFSNHKKEFKVLELGVGSGCLIITLLKIFNRMSGVAVDISKEALLVSKKNAEKHQVEKRLRLLWSDLFSNLDERFDFIVSNPPYIQSKEIEALEPEVRLYEPKLALDGGNDGLDFYRKIAASAKDFLNQNGKVFLEIGYGQKEKIVDIFIKNKFSFINFRLDLAGITRVLEFGV